MSSSEINNTASTCNYAYLNNYNGLATLPNTLNNISVKYPIAPNYQIIPQFAGTGDYSKPNYNTLCKGSCYNYAGINQAYIDCSNPESKQFCGINGGKDVVYNPRMCAQQPSDVRYKNVNGVCMQDPTGPFTNIAQCRSQTPNATMAYPSQ